ncbi:hypothetical protein Pla52o_11780 [Novipirellula galeiformis]|uniref:Uncharacterized protein n=1 Tax=Novipirellula galeiformis TaxID=2528004 RepID=A0A5C6CKE5_9BACT|nr:hypothetical protein Pla52o_11780 [Novipirellula galeiformis]
MQRRYQIGDLYLIRCDWQTGEPRKRWPALATANEVLRAVANATRPHSSGNHSCRSRARLDTGTAAATVLAKGDGLAWDLIRKTVDSRMSAQKKP